MRTSCFAPVLELAQNSRTLAFVVRCDEPAEACATVLSVVSAASEHPEWDAHLVLLSHDARLVHPVAELVSGDVAVALAPLLDGWDAGIALTEASRVALVEGSRNVDPQALAQLLDGPDRCARVDAADGTPAPPVSVSANQDHSDSQTHGGPGGGVGATEVRALHERLLAAERAVTDAHLLLQQLAQVVQAHEREVARTADQVSALEEQADRTRRPLPVALTSAGLQHVDVQVLTELISAVKGVEDDYRRMRARTEFVSSFETRLSALEAR